MLTASIIRTMNDPVPKIYRHFFIISIHFITSSKANKPPLATSVRSVTNSKKHNYSWKPNSYSVAQEILSPFMETEDLLPWSREPATGPYWSRSTRLKGN
jgi:hypothetical protein